MVPRTATRAGIWPTRTSGKTYFGRTASAVPRMKAVKAFGKISVYLFQIFPRLLCIKATVLEALFVLRRREWIKFDDGFNQQLLAEPQLQIPRYLGAHLDQHPVRASRTLDRRAGNIAEPLFRAYSFATRFALRGNDIGGQNRILRAQLTGTCNAGIPRPA
jgi:hypothetical protein